MFLATQLLALFVMMHGRPTCDRTIAVVGFSIGAAFDASLRQFRNAAFYVVFYMTLPHLGIIGSASPQNTGISSTLIPYVALRPIMCGLTAGAGAAA